LNITEATIYKHKAQGPIPSARVITNNNFPAVHMLLCCS